MEYISCSIHILVYHDLHECWFLLTISDLSLLVSWFARTSLVVWWIFPKMNMKKSCQILVHTETLSFQFLPYCHFISSPAQILWRISKPGMLSWTCPLYSFENLHAPTSPLERRPLLLASLRKPEKNGKTNYLPVHRYLLVAIFLIYCCYLYLTIVYKKENWSFKNFCSRPA